MDFSFLRLINIERLHDDHKEHTKKKNSSNYPFMCIQIEQSILADTVPSRIYHSVVHIKHTHCIYTYLSALYNEKHASIKIIWLVSISIIIVTHVVR